MRAHSLVWAAAVLGSITGCSGGAPPPPVEPAPVVNDAAVAKAAATPGAEAQVAAPAPTAVETAAPAAGNLPPPPAPRAADSITRLPAGGAVYFAALPDEIDVTGGVVSEAAQEAMRDLGRVLGVRSAEKLFEDAGIDARGTVLGALLSPSEKSARAVIDGLVAGASATARTASATAATAATGSPPGAVAAAGAPPGAPALPSGRSCNG